MLRIHQEDRAAPLLNCSQWAAASHRRRHRRSHGFGAHTIKIHGFGRDVNLAARLEGLSVAANPDRRSQTHRTLQRLDALGTASSQWDFENVTSSRTHHGRQSPPVRRVVAMSGGVAFRRSGSPATRQALRRAARFTSRRTPCS